MTSLRLSTRQFPQIWDFLSKRCSYAKIIILASYLSRHKITEGKKDNKKRIHIQKVTKIRKSITISYLTMFLKLKVTDLTLYTPEEALYVAHFN